MNTFDLEEEVRCDFHITKETKELWAIQMDLYDQLKSICEKHNITFFAGGGTLLGAVRHKGYIPWDDDMDFFMMYEDYCKFREVAPNELKDPYYMSSWQTDGLIPQMTRIRNSNTTGCTKSELQYADHKKNLGIFIDIFPLMNVQVNQNVQFIQKTLLRFLLAAKIGAQKKTKLIKEQKYTIKNMFTKSVISWNICRFFISQEQLSLLFEKIAQWSKTDTEKVGLITFSPYKKNLIWERSWFQNGTIELPFENRVMVVSKEYEAILAKQYGNWHEFVRGTASHSLTYLDPKTPYKQKLSSIIDYGE